MTTGNEVKQLEEIDTLTEEGDGKENGEQGLATWPDVKPKANGRLHRLHSVKRGLDYLI